MTGRRWLTLAASFTAVTSGWSASAAVNIPVPPSNPVNASECQSLYSAYKQAADELSAQAHEAYEKMTEENLSSKHRDQRVVDAYSRQSNTLLEEASNIQRQGASARSQCLAQVLANDQADKERKQAEEQRRRDEQTRIVQQQQMQSRQNGQATISRQQSLDSTYSSQQRSRAPSVPTLTPQQSTQQIITNSLLQGLNNYQRDSARREYEREQHEELMERIEEQRAEREAEKQAEQARIAAEKAEAARIAEAQRVAAKAAHDEKYDSLLGNLKEQLAASDAAKAQGTERAMANAEPSPSTLDALADQIKAGIAKKVQNAASNPFVGGELQTQAWGAYTHVQSEPRKIPTNAETTDRPALREDGTLNEPEMSPKDKAATMIATAQGLNPFAANPRAKEEADLAAKNPELMKTIREGSRPSMLESATEFFNPMQKTPEAIESDAFKVAHPDYAYVADRVYPPSTHTEILNPFSDDMNNRLARAHKMLEDAYAAELKANAQIGRVGSNPTAK